MVDSWLQTGLRKLYNIFYLIWQRVIKNKIICYFSMWNCTRGCFQAIRAFLTSENDSLLQLLVPDNEMPHPTQQNIVKLLPLYKFSTNIFIFMIIRVIEFKFWNYKIIFGTTKSSIIIGLIFGNLKKWSSLSQK